MKSTFKAASTQTVTIELLALDLKTCTRCVGSLTNIQRAIAVDEHLKKMGLVWHWNRIAILSH
jgi:hypothetical protein